MAYKLFRSIKSKFGINAPRLLVRTHIPWPLRMVAIGVLVAAGLLLGQWVFETGLRIAGFEKVQAQEQMEQMRSRLAQLEQENTELKGEKFRIAQQIEIEQTTHKDLAKSLQGLQEENVTLREDNAFFRNLLSPDQGPGPITIYLFKLERNPLLAGEYRYRLLPYRKGRAKEAVAAVDALEAKGDGWLLPPEARLDRALCLALAGQRDAARRILLRTGDSRFEAEIDRLLEAVSTRARPD